MSALAFCVARGAARRRRSWRARCFTWSATADRKPDWPARCRTWIAAWSRLRARLAPRPPCSCWMSRPPASMTPVPCSWVACFVIAVVLVEHDMALVMSTSDEIVVLDAGRRIAAGTPAVVRADPAVKAAYLGAMTSAQPVASRQAGPTLLNVRGLNAGYGPLAVLDQVGLRIGRGETIAVLGPNGAGKSTLMKALSGLIRPIQGTIGFGGVELEGLSAHRVARAGLILVPEGRQVFPQLTVAENLRLGATRRRDFEFAEIETMLDRFPPLRPRLHTAAGLLSGGEQQMLAVARGLLARPDILLLDEPSLGLAPAVAAELFAQLRRLREEGMTLLIVDQMADHVLAIADRGYVLGGGRVVAQGPATGLRGAMLDDAYLGALPAAVN